VIDVPEEQCDLNPQKTCRFATRLAPKLKPVAECTIIPQETCSLKFSPPRQEEKDLLSEWCQDDSPIVPDQVGNRVTTNDAFWSQVYFPRPLATASLSG
jgi:hypothetical protein